MFLLYLGTETGSREDCSIFYVHPLAFVEKEDAEVAGKRFMALAEQVDADNPYYHILEVHESTEIPSDLRLVSAGWIDHYYDEMLEEIDE